MRAKQKEATNALYADADAFKADILLLKDYADRGGLDSLSLLAPVHGSGMACSGFEAVSSAG